MATPLDRAVPRGRLEAARWAALDLRRLDPDREWPYWLAISGLPGIGSVSFARILAAYGSAEAAWAAGSAFLRHAPNAPAEAPAELEILRREGIGRFRRRVEASLARLGGKAVTALDAAYPAALRELEPRPPVLYAAGDLAALDDLSVAVVGTRRPTGYGLAVAAEMGDELARAGVTLVSGLAIGIDGEAHRAAVDAGGRSVAVLPSPLDRIYPPRHQPLAQRLIAAGGALVTELPPGRPVGRPDFARRNAVIAGVSRATVVIEAPDGSGALLTAAAALRFGRELYAVPGPIDSASARGCNRLIADHAAALVTSPIAMLHQLGATGTSGEPVSVSTLSDAEGLVLARLLEHSSSIEELIGDTRLEPGQLAGTLTLLEVRQLVSSFGGATFHATPVAKRLASQLPGRLKAPAGRRRRGRGHSTNGALPG